MLEQSKPLKRSLIYLHMNAATNGVRGPLDIRKGPKLSVWFSLALTVLVVYVTAAIVVSMMNV